MKINEQQKNILLNYYDTFSKSSIVINEGQEDDYKVFDEKRIKAIPTLLQLMKDYVDKKISIEEFKESNEILCRKLSFWGFKSFSGQMQINQYTNNIKDERKDRLLRSAMILPKNEEEIKAKINAMANFLTEMKDSAEESKRIPRISQIYMLSYFWELQSEGKMPAYYGSNKKALIDMGFKLDVQDTYGDEYLEFLKIWDAIKELYKKERNMEEEYPNWFIEHIFWYNLVYVSNNIEDEPKEEKRKNIEGKNLTTHINDWIPPIINDLEELANNKETEWSIKKGLKPEKAFETKLRYVFILLGYEVTELGQGTGRQPDGIAISSTVGDCYAIIYDAKARTDEYNIGTDDRSILEYIKEKNNELHRKRISKSCFIIISSNFNESETNMNKLREIYRTTRVPIVFLKASDLLFIVESKLQDVFIDHVMLENLFIETGVVTREKIINTLGIR